jgi:glycosyltransferase involved in cell wall biosynthesis
MVYAGKFGGWYMQREMVEFFVRASRVIDDLHFLVLTQSEPSLIANEFTRYDVNPDRYTITRVAPERVGAYLAASDFAIAFYKSVPSTIACSPTKVGEYFAAGLPIIASVGVGDLDDILVKNQIGVQIREHTTASYDQGAQQMKRLLNDEQSCERCQCLAQSCFSLEDTGVPRYEALYLQVAGGKVKSKDKNQQRGASWKQ